MRERGAGRNMIGEIIWAVGIVAWYVIRYPFERKAKRVRVVRNERTPVENAGLASAIIGMAVIPAITIATGWPQAASYEAQPWAIVIGTLCFAGGLWMFRRSHKDLGRNWSISLEIREEHKLVTRGVYSLIRHPMYTAFLLMAVGQAFLISNWVGGLAGLVGFSALFFPRVGKEERLMLDTFGEDYARYMGRTRRLVPWLY